MALTLVTGPTELPVTFAEIKEHLRIVGDDEDAHLTTLLRTAIETAEREFARALITQTWRLFMDAFPAGGFIPLPKPPLSSVTSLKTYDTADAATTVATTVYRVDTETNPGRIVLKDAQTWPDGSSFRTASAIEVEFVAGYGADWNSVPRNIRHWIKLEVSDLNENREPVVVGAGGATPLSTKDRLLWHERAYSWTVPV